MNLGQAVAVCAYELTRDAKAAAVVEPMETQRISAVELDRIEERLYGILEASGYTQPKTADTTRLKLRRLLPRMDMQDADAEVWLGMLRQIDWKIGTGPK